MASNLSFDTTGLIPLNSRDTELGAPDFDVSGLKPLDTTGLIESGENPSAIRFEEGRGLIVNPQAAISGVKNIFSREKDTAVDEGISLRDQALNIAKGAGERVGDLGAGLITTIDTLSRDNVGVQAAQAASDWWKKQGVRMPFILTPEWNRKAKDYLQNLDFGYVPGTTWEQVKESPIDNVIPFILEQGLVSSPDMIAALGNFPAYIAARTGELADERALNDERSQPTVEDLLTVLPASSASAILERFGARSMLGLDDVAVTSGRGLLKQTTKAGLIESGGEAIDEFAEAAATTAGTKQGFEVDSAVDRAAAGAVGGLFGAPVRAITGGVELSRQRTAPVGETNVEGEALSILPSNVSDADVASPIPTDIISLGRTALEAVSGNQTEAINSETVAKEGSSFQPLYDEDSGELIGQFDPATGQSFFLADKQPPASPDKIVGNAPTNLAPTEFDLSGLTVINPATNVASSPKTSLDVPVRLPDAEQIMPQSSTAISAGLRAVTGQTRDLELIAEPRTEAKGASIEALNSEVDRLLPGARDELLRVERDVERVGKTVSDRASRVEQSTTARASRLSEIRSELQSLEQDSANIQGAMNNPEISGPDFAALEIQLSDNQESVERLSLELRNMPALQSSKARSALPTDTKLLSDLEAQKRSLSRRVDRAFKRAARTLDTAQQVTKIKVSQKPRDTSGLGNFDLTGLTAKENASSEIVRELKSRVPEEDVKNRLRENDADVQNLSTSENGVNDNIEGTFNGFNADNERQLRSHFRQLGLNNRAALFFPREISQELAGAKYSANGRFVQAKKDGVLYRIVEVAQDAPNKVHTLNHESIHVLRSIGAFKTSEWSALTKAARKDEALMQRIERLYADQQLSEEALVEEAVADLFADWMLGRSSHKGFIQQAFERLRKLLDSIREVVTGSVSAQTTLLRVEDGEVGRRNSGTQTIVEAEKLQAATDVARIFKDKVNQFLRGTLKGSDVPIVLPKSSILAKVGENSAPVVIQQGTLAKVLKGKHGDKVSAQLVRNLPVLLEKPVLVFRGADRRYSFVLGEKDAANNQVVAVIAPDTTVGRYKLNVIKTIHGKDRFNNWLEARHNNDALMYEDEKRSGAYLSKPRSKTDNLQEAPNSGLPDNPTGTISPRRSDNATLDAEPNVVNNTQDTEKFQAREAEPSERADFGVANRSVWEHLTATQLDTWQKLKAASSQVAFNESFDRLRANIQDSMMPLLRTQRRIEMATGTPLDERSDAYLHHKLMTGRVGARLEKLHESKVVPLFTEMQKLGVSQDELETYLYARHAQERNAYISKVNDKFKEGEGSGMSDADAKAILEAVEVSKKKKALEGLAARVDAIIESSMNERIEAGLLSADEASGLRARWKHYVPLRGEADLDPADVTSDARPVQSKGITVKGKEYRHAFGRKSRATDILPYIFMQAQEGIIRGEKNRVAQSFVKLVDDNENKAFWEVQKITLKPHLNKSTGQVRYVAQNRILAEDADYTVVAKFGGVEKRVTLNRRNPHAVRLAEAMRNLGAQELGGWVRAFGKVNRWLSLVNTSLNPEFVISNAFRDLQTGLINVRQHDIKGISSKVFKDYPAALKASMKANFDKGEGEWQRWYEEYVSEGGRVYFNTTDDLVDMRKKLSAVMQDAKGGKSGVRIVKVALDMIGRANQGIESAVRLSAYKNLREAGYSKKQAAAAAKGLTVDFNVKGKYGPFMNSLYLFANASIQGSVTLLSAAKRSSRVRKALALMVGLGAASELLNQMMSAIDDDDEKFYDKIPEYEKSRNLIIMIPGSDKYAKVPLPYGANAFTHLGRAMVELMAGRRDKLEVIADLTTTTVDAFNPMGGSNNFLNFIAPTIVDPLIDIERNRNFADRPIMPEENPFGHKGPDSQRKFNSVPWWAQNAAEGLNSITGGDEVRPGAIDVSPETLEYIVGTAFGSMASFFERGYDLPFKLLDPTKPLSANDIPLVRKVLGQKSDWLDRNTFYSRWHEIETLHNEYREYQKRALDDKADRLYNEYEPVLALRTYARKTKARLKRYRDLRVRAEGYYEAGDMEKSAYEAEILSIQADEKEVIASFNREYVAALRAMR